MDVDTVVQPGLLMPDVAAASTLVRRIFALCSPGTRLIVGREYTLGGMPGPYVASVSDAYGAGPQAVGISERTALEALLRALQDFQHGRVD